VREALLVEALRPARKHNCKYLPFLLSRRQENEQSLRTIFDLAATLQVKPSEIVTAIERLVGRTERKTGKS
jgi:hypothetical protein